jgi:DUF2911 family protein
MKQIITAGIALALACLSCPDIAYAQLTTLPNGGNKKASVSERIGLTDVIIHYDRPGLKGREDHIWGKLIPVGYTYLGAGNSMEAPWRAGANENTTIEFSDDVKINGHDLPAGKYGFFIAYAPDECTLIFSKNNSSWGSFFYDPKEDALRVKVKPVAVDKSVEWLKYEFTNETENSAVIALEWEKLMIPFTVEVDYMRSQLETFRKELRSDKMFIWQTWNQAAQWCLQKDTNLNQALAWSDTATNTALGGDKSFQTWSTRALILEKLGRSAEATETMKKAWPYGNMADVHNYARQLVALKKSKEALAVFQMNYDKYPGDFVTCIGLARGYSATGNYTKAIEFAQKALPLTNPGNKAFVETMIQTLKEGKDIN